MQWIIWDKVDSCLQGPILYSIHIKGHHKLIELHLAQSDLVFGKIMQHKYWQALCDKMAVKSEEKKAPDLGAFCL